MGVGVIGWGWGEEWRSLGLDEKIGDCLIETFHSLVRLVNAYLPSLVPSLLRSRYLARHATLPSPQVEREALRDDNGCEGDYLVPGVLGFIVRQ